MKRKRKIVVAVTGASGALYARLLLGRLASLDAQTEEVAVVFSANATEIWAYETGDPFEAVPPFKIYDRQDFYAPLHQDPPPLTRLSFAPVRPEPWGALPQAFPMTSSPAPPT